MRMKMMKMLGKVARMQKISSKKELTADDIDELVTLSEDIEKYAEDHGIDPKMFTPKTDELRRLRDVKRNQDNNKELPEKEDQ